LEQSENTTIQDLWEKSRQLTQAYQELQAAQAQIIEKERLEHCQEQTAGQCHPQAGLQGGWLELSFHWGFSS